MEGNHFLLLNVNGDVCGVLWPDLCDSVSWSQIEDGKVKDTAVVIPKNDVELVIFLYRSIMRAKPRLNVLYLKSEMLVELR